MINNRDEIIKLFAKSIVKLAHDDQLSDEEIDALMANIEFDEDTVVTKNPFDEDTDVTKSPFNEDTAVTEVPFGENKQISQRDSGDPINEFRPNLYRNFKPENEEHMQLSEENYTYFLLGAGRYRDGDMSPIMAKNIPLVGKIMDNYIVDENPEKYFKEKLHHRMYLKPWLIPAAKSYVDKNPIGALHSNMVRIPELKANKGFLRSFWIKAYEAAEVAAGKSARGIFFEHDSAGLTAMRRLSGVMATFNPDFYIKYIAPRDGLTRAEHTEKARINLKHQQEMQNDSSGK